MVFARGCRPRAAVRSLRRGARMGASGSVPDRDAPPVAVERLKRRNDFRAAAADGLRSSGPAFVLQARPRGDQGAVRVGFTVSRQVGNAVERNRVRRRLREIVRLSTAAAGHLRAGHDYVLIGRRAALAASFTDMLRELAVALSRVHAAAPAKRGGRGGTGGAPRDVLHEAGSQSRPIKPRRGRSTKRPKSGLANVASMIERAASPVQER